MLGGGSSGVAHRLGRISVVPGGQGSPACTTVPRAPGPRAGCPTVDCCDERAPPTSDAAIPAMQSDVLRKENSELSGDNLIRDRGPWHNPAQTLLTSSMSKTYA